ncbi:MAG TPA: SNF2-related protein, partial [Geobacteraceae bacterium]
MPAYSPHPYQKHAIKFVVERGSAGLFLRPGLGKTSITYAAYKVLRRAKRVERMLVIAPLRPATSTWPREGQKWDDFKDLNVHVLHGDHKQMLLEQPHDISIINPEGLKWLLG